VLHITDASKIEALPEGRTAAAADPVAVESKSQVMAADKKADDKKTETVKEDKPTAEERKADKAEVKEQVKAHKKKAKHAGETVKQAAEQIKSTQKVEEKVNTSVDVTTIVHEAPGPEIIAEEAAKGYDLMLIGLEKMTVRGNEFHDSVISLAQGFKGPLGIAMVRGSLLEKPRSKLHILVPINGTAPSRRAAEVAITIARANKASLTVLYVAVRGAGKTRRGARVRTQEEAILKDITAIADGYNMSVQTSVVIASITDEAIVKEATRGKNNLIVMGVARRPGEKLFFGDTASALMKDAEQSLLFVAS
jgi:nucleotide-binding universal stress UspA family protein